MNPRQKPMGARELRRSMGRLKDKTGQLRQLGQGMHQILDAIKQVQGVRPDLIDADQIDKMQADMNSADEILAAVDDLDAGIATAMDALGEGDA